MGKNRAVSMNFGCMIKYLREQRNYTLDDLSKLTGISKSYISRLQANERKAPSIPIVKLLADGLGVEMSELLALTNIPVDDIKSLSELILSNDFTINGQAVGREIKEKIVIILETIVNSSWTKETKILDAFRLCELVDNLRHELEIKMLGTIKG